MIVTIQYNLSKVFNKCSKPPHRERFSKEELGASKGWIN